MDKAAELGAARKAIIFTESRRTQDYSSASWRTARGRTASCSSTGRTPIRAVAGDLRALAGAAQGTDRVTGSRTADMRSALVDYFRDEGQIMIATEAAAEGINLQFCSLVVNYDLPWNPQRIEQRIGRCHRYGQKHDVVVVNFLNRTNEADQRVFELLSEKFRLFDGVFGASDEVLGAIEIGRRFRKADQRDLPELPAAGGDRGGVPQLQMELSAEINEQMTKTRQKLLENFDDEVREKLRAQKEASEKALGRYEQLLMDVTRFELNGHAEFMDESAFRLNSAPFGLDDAVPGRYELPRRNESAHVYRARHPSGGSGDRSGEGEGASARRGALRLERARGQGQRVGAVSRYGRGAGGVAWLLRRWTRQRSTSLPWRSATAGRSLTPSRRSACCVCLGRSCASF